MRKLFNNDWAFVKTEVGLTLEEAKKLRAKPVDIPHDWLIHQTKALYETSVGWYFKSFNIEDTDKVYKLNFDGVYQDSTVFLNDEAVFEWKYGYSAFEVDLTGKVKKGENKLVVRVCHESPNSRWYSGAGIFRDVHLIEKNHTYLASNGVYFSARSASSANSANAIDYGSKNSWNVKLSAEALNAGEEFELQYTISDSNGNFAQISSKCGEEANFTVENPVVWSIENPHLYTLKTALLKDGKVYDEDSCNIGFRTIEFTTDKGFFLNGKHVKLHGVCMHHDLGALGAAINKHALRRQIRIMQEMGVNSIRTSHNMPARSFMELCDEMGILVVSEAFDMWELKKNEFDYARFFGEWYERDVASWVRRDRNCPSIIMWSVGNEIYDTHASKRGEEVTKMLCDAVRKHDPYKNGFTTIGSNYIEWQGAQNCSNIVDVSGYNYGELLYDAHHEKYPHWKIYGSETASRVQSRGIYHFPKATAFLTHDDLQCSGLENCRAGESDRTAQDSIIWDRDAEFCAGQYIWTGFDYIGEPSPYWTKNSYFGQVDTAGFKKDAFYLYQAAWTDKSVLHLFPYWDFNQGQKIDIMAYTNLFEVELILNGKSLGRKARGNAYSVEWQLNYCQGELVAIGYDESGKELARDSVRSFGDTASLELTADKDTLLADGTDLMFVEISAMDANGTFVANARDRVSVKVSGAGRLIGLDSGDSTDFDEYKGSSKRLFAGKLLAMIASKPGEQGEIKVEVTANGLSTVTLAAKAIPAQVAQGTSNALCENIEGVAADEIPVRKIELTAATQALNPDNRESAVKAQIFPHNSSFSELEWSVVTNSGVKTPIAEVVGEGSEITIKAIGDGTFRLRCTASNGKTHPDVVSELEYEITGLGRAVGDPYKFMQASLYSACLEAPDEVANGGVSVMFEKRNMVGFRKLDFGKDGAFAFDISLINWFKDDEVYFSLYKGIYGEEGAEKLGDFTYITKFEWQTYKPNTFKLDKKLIGVQDISFVFQLNSEKRVYFGGFEFKSENRAYNGVFAAENDHIHGDSFEIMDNEIHRIGNNVFIDFKELLLDKGATKVVVCGRTWNENDSIHLKINSENGEDKTILEFTKSDEFEEKTFDIKKINGLVNARFEFLPGCDFDFKWFKFI